MSDREDGTTDPTADRADPRLDAGVDAEVQRLLASARVTDPTPPEVRDRLDATLASLHAEREASSEASSGASSGVPGTGSSAPVVVPLRRRWSRVLVAAAAVVAIGAGGVAVAQLAGRSPGGSDTAASGPGAADRAESGAGATSKGADSGSVASDGSSLRAVPRLTTAGFQQDVARVMRAVDARTLSGLSAAPGSGSTGEEVPAPSAAAEPPTAPPVTSSPDAVDPMVERDLASCAGPAVAGAVTLPATLDGRLVALVFRTPSEDQQVVEAWSCDGVTVLATTTIPR